MAKTPNQPNSNPPGQNQPASDLSNPLHPIPADHQLARTDAPTPVQPLPPGHDKSGPKHDDHEGIPDALKPPGGGMVALVAGIFVLLMIAIFFVGWIPGHREEGKARDDAIAQSKAAPVAQWSRPVPNNGESEVRLPCDVTSFQHTALFTQANGYLVDLKGHDIGSKVKKDDVLAVIDMPVVDAQVKQAEAGLEQANASVKSADANKTLAKATYDRYLEAQKTDSHSVTQEDIDTYRARFEVAEAALVQATANVSAAEATLKQNKATQSFEKIIAPYTGTITVRNYFVGQLLLSTQVASGQEVFDIDEVDKMRVFVNVPQSYANNVVVGSEATLAIRNYPGRDFTGHVALSAGAVDVNTRTLRVEVDFDNADGALLAGEYGELKLPVSAQAPVMLIPSSALIFNDKGLTVATLTADNKIHIKHVKEGRDFGVELEITEGLEKGDRIVLNPGERFAEGTVVEPREQPMAATPKRPASTQPATTAPAGATTQPMASAVQPR